MEGTDLQALPKKRSNCLTAGGLLDRRELITGQPLRISRQQGPKRIHVFLHCSVALRYGEDNLPGRQTGCRVLPWGMAPRRVPQVAGARNLKQMVVNDVPGVVAEQAGRGKRNAYSLPACSTPIYLPISLDAIPSSTGRENS
jgi:hypothetical protein